LLKRNPDHRKSLRLPLTPLIDCTFLLIIFFLVAAQMAGRELPELDLASPGESSAAEMPADRREQNHVTVNVLTRYGGKTQERDPRLSGLASRYQVGVDGVEAGAPGAIGRLRVLLRSRKAQAARREVPEFWVEIRADRDVRYGDVQPVMQAASEAGIGMMSLTAEEEE
jgi:biopolymer transport protein ExbD